MFDADKSNKQFEAIRIKKKIEDNNGLSEKWSFFIVESFNHASESGVELFFEQAEVVDNKKSLILPNGCKYEGDLVCGKLHGKGKMIFPDGRVYVGDFEDGYQTGRGELTFPDGQTYIGEMLKDYYHGYGKYIWPNGDVYEGDFVQGKRNGKGKMTWIDGAVYEGDFFNDFLTGKAKYTRANGEKYEGDFVDATPHGKGEFVWVNGDTYEGDFVQGKRNGKGKMTWIDGAVYEGDFINDFRTGKAKYTMANGEKYEGDFVDAQPHGKGKFVWVNGDTYEGDFVRGKITGNGTMIQNGVVQKGFFEDGILKKCQENDFKSYNELESHFIKGKKSLDARKKDLEDELQSLSVFDIKKKLEIRRQIQEIEKELSANANDILLREWDGSKNTNNKIQIMEVDDRFSIAGRGTVLVGKVLNKRLNSGDTIIVNEKSYMVTAIEMNRKISEYAEPGDEISILVRNLNRRDVEKGDYVYIEN